MGFLVWRRDCTDGGPVPYDRHPHPSTESQRVNASQLPILFALTSSVLFAFSIQFQGLGLRDTDSRTATLISIGASTVLYWLVAPLLLRSEYWVVGALLIFCAVGLIRPFLSSNLALAGVTHLGPTLATTLAATSPFFGALLGVFWLGEIMTWPLAFGTAGIMAGIVMLAHGGRTKGDWPMWALALPVGAATIRAFGHVFSKVGMEIVPSPYFAGLVTLSVSFCVALGFHAIRRRRPFLASSRRSILYFGVAGVANGVSLLSLNTALSGGDVVVIIPIVATSPVITLLLGRFVFRQEMLTPRAMMAVLMIVPAVIIIAVGR